MSEQATANQALIERFYEAFDRHEGEAMAACYGPDARFQDPAFGGLHGEEPGAMWKMLTGRADDLRVRLAEHDADETTGSAHWLADYTFTQTGRKVHNDVHARFRFADGLHRRARRLLRLPRLGASGAGSDRAAARLDPDRAGQGAASGTGELEQVMGSPSESGE